MNIWTIKKGTPQIATHSFIAPGAQIIGEVIIGSGTSVWHNAVIRGDMAGIRIGKNSNIQDNSVVHVASGFPTIIGDYVTVGHGAIIHGCIIGDKVLVGMNATILDGAEIGDGCIIGANALVPQGKKIPPNSMVLGVPGKVAKTLSADDVAGLEAHALKYRSIWEELYQE